MKMPTCTYISVCDKGDDDSKTAILAAAIMKILLHKIYCFDKREISKHC